MRKAFLFALCLSAASGEIIDRVVAIVANNVITHSDVQREARLEAFFRGDPAPPASSPAGRDVLDRLIQQRLILHEMEQSASPDAEEDDVKIWLSQHRPKGIDSAPFGLKEQDLLDYSARQVRIEDFINTRFKPGLEIPPADVSAYYEQKLVPELKRQGVSPMPSLEQVQTRIEQLLIEERVNGLLDSWLNDLRNRVRVKVVEEASP